MVKKAKEVPIDYLAAAYQLVREYVLRKQMVYSIKICVNIDEYFSVDVQLNRFESSLKHYIWFGIGNEEENQRKWKEIMDYINSSTEKKETIKERVDKIRKKK